MTLLADLLSTLFERRLRLGAPAQGDPRPVEQLAAELLLASSETAMLFLARQIIQRYGFMDDAARLNFFRHLARDMAVDPTEIRLALDFHESERSVHSYRRLMAAVEPPRQELVRRLNGAPGATGSLVKLRADLLRLGDGDSTLESLDVDFQHLFRSWFNQGFLVLRLISWESPAHILEKIIAYEAVHAIESWDDLRLRLAPLDRRCFAFFHPAMPDEPLIFVEIALTHQVPSSIQLLLADDRPTIGPEEADTAVFYSISNCQPGLAHISFGNSLIKQVVGQLAAELPGLKTFVTLSPIPDLVKWLTAEGINFTPEDPAVMRALATHYLLNVKSKDGRPADKVARFHLANGASVYSVHAGADISEKGIRQSGGVMVSYLYNPAQVEKNHEAFAESHSVAAAQPLHSLAISVESSLRSGAQIVA